MAAASIIAASALRRVHAEASNSGIESDSESTDGAAAANLEMRSWDSSSVETWLAAHGLPVEVVRAAREADVDGATLMQLTEEGWAELGLVSKVAQAKVRARAYQEQHEDARDAHRSSKREYPKSTEKEVLSLLQKHWGASLTGAEHSSSWHVAIASANPDQIKTKENLLRYLGMYNVVDLLTFTIVVSYLFAQRAATSWWSVFLQTLAIRCCFMTGISLVSSTVMYNASSSVSDANVALFAKLPATTHLLKHINDDSVWGFLSLLFMAVLLGMQLGLGELVPLSVDTDQHLSSATAEYIAFVVVRILLVGLQFFAVLWGKYSNWGNWVFVSTHVVLFGGLMGDAEVLPPGETSGWAVLATSSEVEAFACGLLATHLSLAERATSDDVMLQRYAAQSGQALKLKAISPAVAGHAVLAALTARAPSRKMNKISARPFQMV
ncbi:hypothetical protein T484DRAFT_1958309 [Baffinella frigidus]|nr:hypothetical protein T484DRAFT_1958309 [Cryptophyta sp. CCMP2293]